MRSFYSGLPGLQLQREHFYPDARLRSVWYNVVGSDLLVMLEDAEESKAPGALVLPVTNQEAIEKKLQTLSIYKKTNSSIYFLDPDGNTLGYSQYPTTWSLPLD
ncbi:MAG: hypothetical protein AAF518_11855 [Spirochaetota bacterium]